MTARCPSSCTDSVFDGKVLRALDRKHAEGLIENLTLVAGRPRTLLFQPIFTDELSMDMSLQQSWIPLDRVESAIRFDVAVVVFCLAVGSWVVYKLFLRQVSEERHQNLRKLFSNLFIHLILATTFFMVYWQLHEEPAPAKAVRFFMGYVGLCALFSGLTVMIKTARILMFEYLFLGHMQQGVPLLLVNLFTLTFSIFVGCWIATEIFGVKVTSLIATSAVFSVVIGLALQDTLGNLFAGAALQFDKPYEIGDWVEINSSGQKWSGQVWEISWRATVLVGFTEEHLTIPNRVVGQAQISNFATKRHPIIRSQVFRLPYGVSQEPARAALIEAAKHVVGVRRLPFPTVLLSEASESYLTFKLVYYIEDYGQQFNIGDRVLTAGIKALEQAGVPMATPRLELISQSHKTS